MSLREEFESSLCPVCMERYDKSKIRPLSLACGHALCAHCLKTARIVKCPMCRRYILGTPPMNVQLAELVDEASRAPEKLRRLVIRAAQREVIYGGMPPSYGIAEITEIFALAGEFGLSKKKKPIISCEYNGRGKVTFKDGETARNAVELLSGTTFPKRTLVLSIKQDTYPHTMDAASTSHCKRSKCPICCKTYGESTNCKPLLLISCGHTVCSNCFDDVVKRNKETFAFVKCPTCSRDVPSMEPPVNFSLIALTDEVTAMREDLLSQIREAAEKPVPLVEVGKTSRPNPTEVEQTTVHATNRVEGDVGIPEATISKMSNVVDKQDTVSMVRERVPTPESTANTQGMQGGETESADRSMENMDPLWTLRCTVKFYGMPHYCTSNDMSGFFSRAGEIARYTCGIPLIDTRVADSQLCVFVVYKTPQMARKAEVMFHGVWSAYIVPTYRVDVCPRAYRVRKTIEEEELRERKLNVCILIAVIVCVYVIFAC